MGVGTDDNQKYMTIEVVGDNKALESCRKHCKGGGEKIDPVA